MRRSRAQLSTGAAVLLTLLAPAPAGAGAGPSHFTTPFVGGAAFVTEDGSESFNHFDRNFAAHVLGNGGRAEVDETGRGVAREGVGFWFRGTNNRVTRNVAVNMIEGEGDVEAAYGFKYNLTFLGAVRIPSFRGADTSVPGEYATREGNSLPLLELANNETYGQIQGLTLW
jgi:hypothetical protein